VSQGPGAQPVRLVVYADARSDATGRLRTESAVLDLRCSPCGSHRAYARRPAARDALFARHGSRHTEGSALSTFSDLGVLPETVQALEAVGITEPFPVQAQTLPLALSGNDIIGQAKTGTGKTLGFGIPLLQRVVTPTDRGYDDLPAPGKPQALVVVPTRELCVQVTGDLQVAGRLRGARVLPVYGGRAYEPQVEALRKGVDIVVGTPGRLLDLAQQGLLHLGYVRMLVLDEADEMLDLGFLPDVERILALIPDGRQTMLFSATMPGAIIGLARRYMTQPTHIRASDPDDMGATVLTVKQFVYRVHAMDKTEIVARMLQSEGRGLTIIFCRTKRTAAKVADDLADRGFAAAAIHGDLGQGAREQALRAFRNGKVDVLVATDVAARGIDVTDVTHVVNYQCPEDEKTYLHRIGRTGRAGASGIAVTFVDWDDMPRWGLIDKGLDLGFPEPVETYSTSEHLYSDLAIPEKALSVLPSAQRTRAGLSAEVVEDLGETGKSRSRASAGGGPGGGGRGASGPGRGASSGGTARRASAPRTDAEGTASDAPAAAEGESRPERPARTRARRRTRSGAPAQEGGASADSSTGATAPAVAVADGEGSDGEPRRRRRSRGGRGRGTSSGPDGASSIETGSAETA
jgi:superfamily II DNA/RNA helicase